MFGCLVFDRKGLFRVRVQAGGGKASSQGRLEVGILDKVPTGQVTALVSEVTPCTESTFYTTACEMIIDATSGYSIYAGASCDQANWTKRLKKQFTNCIIQYIGDPS